VFTRLVSPLPGGLPPPS